MTVGGNHAGAEILLLTITSGCRYIEVPVNYLPRVGASSATGDPMAALSIGLRMIILILRWRLRAPRRLPRAERLYSPRCRQADPKLGLENGSEPRTRLLGRAPVRRV